jgi:hypothetical protein
MGMNTHRSNNLMVNLEYHIDLNSQNNIKEILNQFYLSIER